MTKVYTGTKNSNYTIIEPPIGKGGEGSIYRIKDKSNLVLKVFNPAKRDETRHRKLLAMIKSPLSPHAMKQVTWPVDVVYENGAFIGYVMPLLKQAEKLNVMYSDKYICTLSERIIIAKNLCAAIDAVHQAGQVCGDLNPENINVDPKTGNVTLVDTDSYHITDPKNTDTKYRCEVGRPEYLAKELQDKLQNNKGADLRTLPLPTFTRETDLFALAVHIFALLMNGCHPFACAKSDGSTNISRLSSNIPSVTWPQPVENIRNCFFPFYEKRTGYITPPYAPDFSALPKSIQDMFVQAFVDGGKNPKLRPSTKKWYDTLEEFEKHIKTCPKNAKHEYYDQLKKCPWCEVNTKMSAFMAQQVVLQQKALNSSIQPRHISSPHANTSTNTKSTTAVSKSNTSTKMSIKRDSWPMWLLFIVFGLASGLLLSYFLFAPIVLPWINGLIDFEIPSIVSYILLVIVGGVSGAIISHLAQEKYQTADKGWPWLFLAFCIPVATAIAAALVIAAIALVIGLIYVVIVIAILAIGGAIAAACCGGG